jgi:hypothetical protein
VTTRFADARGNSCAAARRPPEAIAAGIEAVGDEGGWGESP